VSNNLNIIAEAAFLAQKNTGCPGLLQIAQCALETGWLKSAPGNNCFGIKAYTGCHGRQLLTTTEWFTESELHDFLKDTSRTATLNKSHEHTLSGRHEYVVRDWFATFETLANCLSKRASMWDKGHYALAATQYKIDGDLTVFVQSVARLYATAPNYAEQVLSIINQADVQAAWEKVQDVAA
jgi:flagellum-specific peptidoglycan hydrolase FlgJ